MPYLKQIGYTGDIMVPLRNNKDSLMVPFTITKALFSSMVSSFRLFQKLGINVPVTNKHHTNLVSDTLGYVTALWESKDASGRDALFCAIEFNETPDTNILNAGASFESPAIYTVANTGEVLNHPLTSVAITPTPVFAGMESFTLALSLDNEAVGVNTEAVTPQKTMNEQITALILEFLGIDPTEYTGKENELVQKIAQSLAAMKTAASTPESAPEPTPASEPAPTPEPAPASEPAPEPDNKDAVIAELQMSLNAMRQEARMNKLNTLATEGRLTKPAFDKAKAMYGGNLAMSRDKEFNDFVQLIEANACVLT
jgi:uncharacterized protein YkwD